MKFKYQAKTQEGETQVGFVEAASRDSATNILGGHNLHILSLESSERVSWFDTLAGYFRKVGRNDMIIFTRQLATLLEARLPLNNALKTLREQTTQPTLREAINQMSEDIDSGLSLSQAMERQSDVFPQLYVEMIRVAEITANLNEIAGFLADYTEKEGILAGKAASALIYPAIVMALFFVVAFIIVAFVFPQIGPVFAQSGVQLPIYTKFLLAAGVFLGKWWLAVVLIAVVFALLALEYANTEEGQSLIDEGKIKLPLAQKVYLPLILSRFSNAAALLIHGGIPIAQALEVIGHMVGNVLYRDVVHEVAEDVRRGELLSQSLSKYPEYFPSIVPQMIAVGETTGKIEQIFVRLSTFYGREADKIMNNIVDLIQPVLMVAVGGLVGLLFASILIPLYSLTANIR